METEPRTSIQINGTRPGVGATATAMLISSALNATLHTATDSISFGRAPVDIYDVSVITDPFAGTAITVTRDTPEDLALLGSHGQNTLGLIVLNSAGNKPFEFATKAGFVLLGHVEYVDTLGEDYRAGMFRLGYDIAAGLNLRPDFVQETTRISARR